MKKLIQTTLLLAFVVMGMRTQAQNLEIKQAITPIEAVALAQHELPNMLQLIEPEDIKDYGFSLNENFADVKIGRPFYVVSLPRTEASQENITANTTTIMLPLILDGRARCVLFVSPEEGSWKVVGIGEGNFVAAHQQEFNTTTEEDGSSFVMVNVPHMTQQYMMESTDAFKPMYQFEDMDTRSISLAELIAVNNTIPVTVKEVMTNQEADQLNHSQENNK
jgi:hypothetical protein